MFKRYGYGLYSARHGNIYNARRLLQLAQEALGLLSPSPDAFVWLKNGRYVDALRPSVEPDGLSSPQEVVMQRADHSRRFRNVLDEAGLFVFTLGLTEAWLHRSTGLVYGEAPGTTAGHFDPAIHEFRNFRCQEIYDDFVEFRDLAKSCNPNMKFLLTVSPVPLTATATNSHVLTATVRSKSILRTVASQLYDDFGDVDYFPSFELLSTPFLGKSLFEENKRTVSVGGVAAVMRVFFDEHPPVRGGPVRVKSVEDIECEEALLEAFARKQ